MKRLTGSKAAMDTDRIMHYEPITVIQKHAKFEETDKSGKIK